MDQKQPDLCDFEIDESNTPDYRRIVRHYAEEHRLHFLKEDTESDILFCTKCKSIFNFDSNSYNFKCIKEDLNE